MVGCLAPIAALTKCLCCAADRPRAIVRPYVRSVADNLYTLVFLIHLSHRPTHPYSPLRSPLPARPPAPLYILYSSTNVRLLTFPKLLSFVPFGAYCTVQFPDSRSSHFVTSAPRVSPRNPSRTIPENCFPASYRTCRITFSPCTLS